MISKFIPIPYTYDKNGPKFWTFFGKPLFKDRAKGAINLGETPMSWSLSSITSICQRCEQEGRHCVFSSNHGQAFCQHHGIIFPAQIPLLLSCFILSCSKLHLHLAFISLRIFYLIKYHHPSHKISTNG